MYEGQLQWFNNIAEAGKEDAAIHGERGEQQSHENMPFLLQRIHTHLPRLVQGITSYAIYGRWPQDSVKPHENAKFSNTYSKTPFHWIDVSATIL